MGHDLRRYWDHSHTQLHSEFTDRILPTARGILICRLAGSTGNDRTTYYIIFVGLLYFLGVYHETHAISRADDSTLSLAGSDTSVRRAPIGHLMLYARHDTCVIRASEPYSTFTVNQAGDL